MSRVILGVSAFYHDSAAAIIKDNEIIAAAQEERFTRIKHDMSFPINAIKYCLEYSGYNLNELDAIVFYDKPLLKFERLLETYYAYAPRGARSFIAAMPVWIKEKLFIRELISREMKRIDPAAVKKINLLFSGHHLSHAASAFFPSSFSEAAILTIDGVGEWATATIAVGKNNKVRIIKELRFPHSLGLLYSAFTYYLGFKVNSGEYKLMGLAPYGDPGSSRVEKYRKVIYENLIDVREDGSLWLNQRYFDYASGLRMVNDDLWEKLFGFKRRQPESKIEQLHCDLALAIQQVTEKIMLKMAREAKRLTGSRHLCLAGGVALNCVANTKILNSGLFDDIWIQPAAGDAGGALGAALAAYYMHYNEQRISIVDQRDTMQGSYLGPEYSEKQIMAMARKYKATFVHFDNYEELCIKVAVLLAQGKVVGWFQGRMEWGPRALGNRSILGDPRSPEMQKRMNLQIKFRESFRPFAPAVLVEEAQKYFLINTDSPYMLLVADIVNDLRRPLPDNYYQLTLSEKLYYVRSSIPAVTHLDFSARLQTVHKETNPRFHALLSEFKEKTGCPVLINTSFNVRGEPIVCSPEDAYRCFMKTKMDCLVVGNCLFYREEQPQCDKLLITLKDTYGLD